MFYSQFILAKKGPLGTIWIAAHLERKLRKNQVADTDIGVSVDSILFPEVPIALRLSSHLLLGVVRIYSRKVNYLFDDCSEALLKIKQAFRSTAVDLPPEESTAPYHSITLPETFDLDDFELPDNDIFQGSYVDHHISTREQITLQDTMEGVVYSTSQFGLDERFGDGDASQVGLDLEEDMFLDKVAAPGLVVSGANSQASNEMCPKSYASHSGESLEAMPVNDTRNKFEGLAANSEIFDDAQAPSTPGLVQEPHLSSIQEGLAYDDNLESEFQDLTELEGKESTENACSKSDLQKDNTVDLSLSNQLNCDAAVCMSAKENDRLSGDVHFSGDVEINQVKLQGNFLSTQVNVGDVTPGASEGVDKVERINDDVTSNTETSMCSLGQINGNCEDHMVSVVHKNDAAEISNNMDVSHSSGKIIASNAVLPQELPGASDQANVEPQDFPGTKNCGPLDNYIDNEQITSTSTGVLHACTSHMTHQDMSSHSVDNYMICSDLQSVDVAPCSLEASRREEALHPCGTSAEVQDEVCHMAYGIQPEGNQTNKTVLNGETQADDDQYDNTNSSHISDLPAPEKLLSVSERLLDKPDDLLVESTPDKEVQEDGDGSDLGTRISGKKRSFTESTLTVQSLTSMESFEVTKSKRTADFIPDDDDLLSSILIGRRSSVLKLKSTPPAPKAASLKRARSTSKPSALKRKVLMDESMVLLGDTIRQQLTNTEDIRRLRKKAPCTRTEILTIQRQFLEEEIFSELILTGISVELASLHGESFDLSRIRISENDDNNVCLEVQKDGKCSTQPIAIQDCQIEESTAPVIFSNETDGQPAELHIPTVNQPGDNRPDHITSEHERFGEINEMGLEMDNSRIIDARNDSAVSTLAMPTETICGDISEVEPGSVVQLVPLDKTIGADASLQVDSTQCIHDATFSRDTTNGEGLEGTEFSNYHTDKIVVGNDSRVEETISEDSKVGPLVKIGEDGPEAGLVPSSDADILLVNVCSESDQYIDLTSLSADQAPKDIENNMLGVDADDVKLGGDKDQTPDFLCNEESKVDPTYSIALDGDVKNSSFSDRNHSFCQDADQQSAIDAETMSLEHLAAGDCGDVKDVAVANDTEFLNVNDDEVGEEDYGMPGAEGSRLLENSGWSSRTRAVAEYLQTLFDKEAGHGGGVLSVNNLLTGKTRKEAARMFFETLVLKTKDYIHVEQTKPFDTINIKARSKLMKSDF